MYNIHRWDRANILDYDIWLVNKVGIRYYFVCQCDDFILEIFTCQQFRKTGQINRSQDGPGKHLLLSCDQTYSWNHRVHFSLGILINFMLIFQRDEINLIEQLPKRKAQKINQNCSWILGKRNDYNFEIHVHDFKGNKMITTSKYNESI